MDPERWRRVREIAEQASDGDELRREVGRLVARDERSRALEPPTPGTVWQHLSKPAFTSGADLGDFVIERELGAGGMGVVYEARQKHPSRRFALKVLRAGTASAAAVRRFRRESEVLGRLRHPGIAQVYSAGVHVEDGREVPWFAMELVEDARPITAYARARNLSREARLELFLGVCDAVHLGRTGRPAPTSRGPRRPLFFLGSAPPPRSSHGEGVEP